MNAAAKTVTSIAPSKSVSERVEKLDWERVWQELDAQGGVMIGRLLSPDESQSLAALYPKDDIFRSRGVFAVYNRPVQGTRGTYRVNLRHGVSRVRSGQRHTVGIIFHDAQ